MIKMIRQMIKIDDEKCNGCGECANACHEGAIEMVDGKAKLVREDHCDGLGDCLPACPAGAISFETREAPEFIAEPDQKDTLTIPTVPETGRRMVIRPVLAKGELTHWPIKLKLLPPKAPYYEGAEILVAADCTAFANANFHRNFIKGRVTIIGCPKFDSGDYIERLANIFSNNDISRVMVARMEVPCCSELARMVKTALAKSQKKIPYRIVTIATDGAILE